MNPQQIAPWVFLGLVCWALPLLDVRATARIKLYELAAGFMGLVLCYLLHTSTGFGYHPLLAILVAMVTIVSVFKAKSASENAKSFWSMSKFFCGCILIFLLFSRFGLL